MLVAFEQVMVLFVLMAIGYILRIFKAVPKETSAILSKLIVYAFTPALTLSSFIKNFNITYIKENWKLLASSLIILIILVFVACIISIPFSKDRYTRNIYKYSFIVPSFGYTGYALMKGMYGEEMLLNMIVFAIPVSVYTNTAGYMLLSDQRKLSWRLLLSPLILSVPIGAILGLSQIKLPMVVNESLTYLGGCLAPVSMLLTGMVISEFNFKELFLNFRSYIACAIRLIIIPAAVGVSLKLLGASQELLIVAVMFFGLPIGLNTIIFPKTVNKNCGVGASMVFISNILMLFTLPFMLELFT